MRKNLMRIWPGFALSLVLALPAAAGPRGVATVGAAPLGEEVDTEHIFGFSMGSDIGRKGELELEVETVGGFGKRGGRFANVAALTQLKYTAADWFRIAPGFTLISNNTSGVPGWAAAHGGGFAGASLELRAKILDRAVAPFGLTLHAGPGWTRRDEVTGLGVEQYGSDFALLADREIVRDRIFAAFNVWYGVGGGRELGLGGWAHHSNIALHGALSYQLKPGTLVGVEVRYARAYEGMGLDRLEGDAVFVGPTFSLKLGPSMGLSGTWQMQVSGHALGDARALNLEQFERHQAMLRYNYHF